MWARSNNCPWDEKTCSSAAYGGHLDVLRWARQNGCPWDAGVCGRAAEGGHLDLLKWAYAHDCDVSRLTCQNAAKVCLPSWYIRPRWRLVGEVLKEEMRFWLEFNCARRCFAARGCAIRSRCGHVTAGERNVVVSRAGQGNGVRRLVDTN